KITEVLSHDFKQRILMHRDGILRTMYFVYNERLESVPKMNERVIIHLVREFRSYQLQANQNMRLLENIAASKSVYNPIANTVRADILGIRRPNRFGEPMIGDTLRFYFT